MKLTKKLVLFAAAVLLISAALIFCTFAVKEYVYLTVEKSALGGGFITEPVKAEIQSGDTAADIIDRVLGRENINGGSGTGTYIEKIADNGEGQVPEKTSQALGGNIGTGRAEANILAAGDYGTYSGWLFILNGEMAATGISDYIPSDGDVIRITYSVYGYGSDIGFDTSGMSDWGGAAPIYSAVNRDGLIKAAADIGPGGGNLYGSLLAAICDLNLTEEQCSALLDRITVSPDTSDIVLSVMIMLPAVFSAAFVVFYTRKRRKAF